jgi:hypothetical protein
LVILISLFIASIVVAGAQAQLEDNGGGGFEGGESHCALGGMGLLLVVATLGVGFLVSGRFGRISGFRPLPVHKLVVIVMAAYLTGEFIYGSLVRNVLFINTLHGTLGFLAVAMAWLTVSLNPLMLRRAVKWKSASKIHLIFATSVFIVLIVHLAYAFSIFD